MSNRELNRNERGALERVLENAEFAGARALYEQIGATRVIGGISTLLELEVDPSAPPAAAMDGPVPVQARVEDSRGTAQGRIIVWVTEGYLSGLELAWFTDEAPTGLPDERTIRIVASPEH